MSDEPLDKRAGLPGMSERVSSLLGAIRRARMDFDLAGQSVVLMQGDRSRELARGIADAIGKLSAAEFAVAGAAFGLGLLDVSRWGQR